MPEYTPETLRTAFSSQAIDWLMRSVVYRHADAWAAREARLAALEAAVDEVITEKAQGFCEECKRQVSEDADPSEHESWCFVKRLAEVRGDAALAPQGET